MINKIERRNHEIEKIREKYLEVYYDEDQEKKLDSDSLQTLGLNMYINEEKNLKYLLYNAFCKSKYDMKVIMHPQQIECLNILHKGDNLLISAPTSFGKTFVALEYMSRKEMKNIVFVVPTLALMNELFMKIKNKFGDQYNIMQNSYENVEEKNIYIIVPERADTELISKLTNIDLLIFDEIYKLQRRKDGERDDKRIISLNRGYFELVNRAEQVLLLGPFIKDISFGRTKLNENITKYITDYAPVYTKISFIDDKEHFVQDEIKNDNSKLIYFGSPNSIYEFVVNVMDDLEFETQNNSLTKWCDTYISEKWLPSSMLKKGIGIHHGKLPNFIRRYIENMYNQSEINTILCTSTLLEGINTPTNELIVYDSSDLSAFKINNLIGRVGRLNTFQKGQVYLFDRKLEDFLIGDAKYEEIEIVAESSEITDLEEVIYLNKNIEDLDGENIDLFKTLVEELARYNKTIEDLKKTNGFVIAEFLRFLQLIPKIMDAVNKLKTADKEETTKCRMAILECFMEVVKCSRSYMLGAINNKMPDGKRIKNAVCVNKLLNLAPQSIYKRIQDEINKQVDIMRPDVLNLYIDYLFDLAFSYIKHDLTRMVGYIDFIFDENFIQNTPKLIEMHEILEKEILRRLRIYNCDNNLILKILIDLDFPYQDAKNICNIISKDVEQTKISTSTILNEIENKYELIMKSKKIDNVTKDLLKVLLDK